MSSITEVKVPDIGDFKEVDVIEILVKPGDTVAKEASLITVESDKATMEIPSPAAGVVKELKVKLGDKVAEGSMILLLEASAGAAARSAAGQARGAARRSRGGACSAAARRGRAGGGADTPARTGAAGTRRRGARVHAARQPVGAQVRARTRRRSGQGERIRPQGPHHPGRRAGFRQGRADPGAGSGAGRGRAGGRRALQFAGMAAGGFRQVRPDRTEAAVAHQEALRRQSAPQLGFHPACHPVRRGRHHRARGFPQGKAARPAKNRASSSPCSPS